MSNHRSGGRYGRMDDYDADRRRRERSRSRSKGRSYQRTSSRYQSHRNAAGESRSRSRSYSPPERRRHRRRSTQSRSRSNSRGRGNNRGYNTTTTSRQYQHSGGRYQRNEGGDSRSPARKPVQQLQRHRTEPNYSGGGGYRGTTTIDNTQVDQPAASIQLSNDVINLATLPLPNRAANMPAAYNIVNANINQNNGYVVDDQPPIDKERIHREMEEKLRATLAAEGKVYPPPKLEAAHPVFANDGSFIEIFKRMQEAQQGNVVLPSIMANTGGIKSTISSVSSQASPLSSASLPMAMSINKPAQPPPPPMIGRRRGGKILKTGVVAKPKAITDPSVDPKDFWSLYLAEVNKYKSHACESDGSTRPLVK